MFYVACCVEALAYLHEQLGVIYRDLKPENLLLDHYGYCKVTDLGLAKQTRELTYTVVGTHEYMAPEVITNAGYSFPADWWGLGVLTYELLCGCSPFEAPSGGIDGIYTLIRAGIQEANRPPNLRRDQDAVRLIFELCHQQPRLRLGARLPGRQGSEELRQHAWFRGFSWQRLREQRLEPPYRPRVKSSRDTSNFKECSKEDGPPDVPYDDPGDGWDKGFEDGLPEAQVTDFPPRLPPPGAVWIQAPHVRPPAPAPCR